MITPRQPPTVEAVGRHYDDLDVYYRDIWGEHVHHGLWKSGSESPEQACEQLIRLVAEEAGVGDGSVVCDVDAAHRNRLVIEAVAGARPTRSKFPGRHRALARPSRLCGWGTAHRGVLTSCWGHPRERRFAVRRGRQRI